MTFLPKYSEVLVSSLSREEVQMRLSKVTKNINFLDYEDRIKRDYKFSGQINQGKFSISLFIDKGDSFLPLINGKIEETPKGSILFLTYSLFPGSIFFLAFWSLVTLGLSGFFWISGRGPAYALTSFALGCCNYLFAWTYFKRKIGISQHIFHELLNR